MKKPPRTFLLVEAVLDENDVPYLVADPRAPSRRVGVERINPVPQHVDHFAEHFRPRAHPIDATNPLHRAHYQLEAAAGTLKILGTCQAKDADDAAAKFAAVAKAQADTADAVAKAAADQNLLQAEQAEKAAEAQLVQGAPSSAAPAPAPHAASHTHSAPAPTPGAAPKAA
jgi:hypothetical protein